MSTNVTASQVGVRRRKPIDKAKIHLYRRRDRVGKTLLHKARRFHEATTDDVVLVLRNPTSNVMRYYCNNPNLASEFLRAFVSRLDQSNEASAAPSLSSPTTMSDDSDDTLVTVLFEQ